MSDDAMAAGETLAEVLGAENAALAVLDLPQAGAMLARKQRALADLAAAQAVAATTPRSSAERMARRLQGLAIENKRLLERAIGAQSRVIGVIAQAAAASASTGGYGPSHGSRPIAVALSAKA
jgi:hypothetical protein